ncbi:MAG: hypothetical protein IJ131_05875 [Eggerthellaceae bacterium]|nr:hypothetical protein [Eggerthellaceae bacterium]
MRKEPECQRCTTKAHPQSTRPSNLRYLVLACGALNCIACGTCYLYGVFQPYIMDYFSATSATASTPYTLL